MSSLFSFPAASQSQSNPPKPTFSFGQPAATSAPTTQSTTNFSFGGSTLGSNTLGTSTMGGSTINTNTQSTNIAPSSQPAIDLTHIRPTTKFDQLTKDLQNEIEKLDDAIQNQIKYAHEVPDVLAKVNEIGQTIPAAIDLVAGKLDETETGLENDAEAIVALRDNDMKKGEGEAKCVFRAIDRLKVPRQYQVGHKHNESITVGVYGGAGHSGWWNNPQTLKGSVRGAGGQTMQLPGEEVDDVGPKSLVELFNGRSEEFATAIKSNRELLADIESFIGGLEDKVRGKERQLNERLRYGGQNEDPISEKQQQEQLLKFVFGEVERGIYETAGKVAGLRDEVLEITRR